MDLLVLSLIAGAVVAVGLWLATRDTPTESIIKHVTPAGGNVFADLGFEPEEAARLLAEADADAIVPPPHKTF